MMLKAMNCFEKFNRGYMCDNVARCRDSAVLAQALLEVTYPKERCDSLDHQDKPGHESYL